MQDAQLPKRCPLVHAQGVLMFAITRANVSGTRIIGRPFGMLVVFALTKTVVASNPVVAAALALPMDSGRVVSADMKPVVDAVPCSSTQLFQKVSADTLGRFVEN